ncbi:hypothetical protein [Phenylobacterium sp. J367]|uniref:hypothetical protein n=1 Tax=Phenylobacterium sp. J367 TaxID=2898435 RepID=UPI00215101C2|nr:hypothetical protein [Phenylobacterium sp. J367]MCR5881317.1 hypothetical protein [Phenylobacterium sp. J367]
MPPQSAAAQQIVFDPRAVAQAIQQVRQGVAQIQQLQAQVTNQMAMLQRLGTDVTQPLAQINAQATQLMQQAQAIGYNSQNIAGQFQQFYPASMSGQSFAQIQQRLASWEANSRLTPSGLDGRAEPAGEIPGDDSRRGEQRSVRISRGCWADSGDPGDQSAARCAEQSAPRPADNSDRASANAGNDPGAAAGGGHRS